jgi:hypothetical protein
MWLNLGDGAPRRAAGAGKKRSFEVAGLPRASASSAPRRRRGRSDNTRRRSSTCCCGRRVLTSRLRSRCPPRRHAASPPATSVWLACMSHACPQVRARGTRRRRVGPPAALCAAVCVAYDGHRVMWTCLRRSSATVVVAPPLWTRIAHVGHLASNGEPGMLQKAFEVSLSLVSPPLVRYQGAGGRHGGCDAFCHVLRLEEEGHGRRRVVASDGISPGRRPRRYTAIYLGKEH